MQIAYLERLQKIEAVIESWLPSQPSHGWVHRVFGTLKEQVIPVELVTSLTGPGKDLLERGGKRWRPLLMTLICESLGGKEEALALVPLVEFPHNGSLIHDDIEDNSEERRGKPAIHLLYGLDTGVNSGSFLYFLPLACLATWGAPDSRKLQVMECWGEHLRRIHLGQAMDIYWHRDFSSLPSEALYEQMCRLKTGVLARLAAELGVYAAANRVTFPTEQPEHAIRADFGEAAENLGVGFQILDDVKNLTTGNPGKKRGDDIVEGKKSLPIILYLQQDPRRIEFVKRCFSAARAGGTAVPEVEELIGELEVTGVIERARERGHRLIQNALETFKKEHSPLIQDEEAHHLLVEMVSLLG
ncbi:MAG: polyprenyl synthetase family protein [Treponemataceae bacterium]|nr:polyprenyl synthetase family protein [Treponemataceae bacterium]